MIFRTQSYTKILFLFTALTISLYFTASAQELNARKHGTVLEQMEQSEVYSGHHSVVQEILDYAFRFRGVPYRSGSSSPRGFDCSGFTSYVFKRFGVNLTRSSRGQYGEGVRVKRDDLQPGDLVFFNGRARGRGVGHVGIVTQVNDNDNSFKFIHAACSKGITVSHSNEAYYRQRYVGARRVIY